MELDSKIYVAGHRGFIGTAIMKKLRQDGYNNLIYRTSKELDLRNQHDVMDFMTEQKPDYVILNAARIGSVIASNATPAEQIRDNTAISINVIDASYKSNVKKLLFIGSATIYPQNAPQPMTEESLLSGFLDNTHKHHALAKIVGIELCKAYRIQYGCDFISCVPSNIYGVNDRMEGDTVHVISGMMKRMHEAKENNQSSVVIWGTGTPQRDFMYVDDLAEACIFVMNNYSDEMHINVSSGVATSINEVAAILKDVLKYSGSIEHDLTKPDGAAFRILDSSRIMSLGFEYKIGLREGLQLMYNWYLESIKSSKSN